jgi:hypothetical protein
MITIEINNSGASFVDEGPREEIVRILRELAIRIEEGQTPTIVRDLNGNKCGTVSMQIDEK